MSFSFLFIRIGQFIFNPSKIPIKISRKIRTLKELRQFDLAEFISRQVKIFNGYGLSRDEGVKKKLTLDLASIGLNEMESEHSIFFSALSVSKLHTIRRVLEIGTYDGKNAKLLSLLFPDSEIVTYDLSDDDPIFINSYSRSDPAELSRFVDERNAILKGCSNVKQIQKNSLSLSVESDPKYDLIWVDGAHGYPTVAIDIANSLRLLNSKGILICDDVWINTIEEDSMYKSVATYETLEALRHAKQIKYDLLLKRLSANYSATTEKRKYIALVTHENFL